MLQKQAWQTIPAGSLKKPRAIHKRYKKQIKSGNKSWRAKN